MSRFSVLAVLVAALAAQAAAEIKLQSVDRKINLESQFARVTETIKVKNTGNAAVDTFVHCLANSRGTVAYQKISQVLSSKANLQFKPVTLPDAPAHAACVEVSLKQAIPPSEVATVESFAVIAGAQTAYPAEVEQKDPQLMLYADSVYILSPYHVSAQTTEVVLPTRQIKSYTDSEKPVAASDNKVKYGKYDKIKPWSYLEMRLHFENNKHFKKAVTLVREIEVSHWGNIYVEESYELKNDGAKHKGSFSRLKYAHSYGGKGNSFRELKARLPASAHSMYYVDIIGNISTSDVRKRPTETVLDFETRYPLFGGWKVDFKLGYSVPLKGFLFAKKSDGKRRLSFDFSTPLEDVYVEDMVVKVVLPEGASHIKALVPHDVEQSTEVKYTYLDITGRPVVVLHKQHVVPEHAAKFHVDYSFSTLGVLREPLMLVSAFTALFALAIVWNRLEFTISRDAKWQAAQDAEKIATTMQKINSLFEEEDGVLHSIVKLSNSVRVAADAEGVQRERSALEAAFSQLENNIKALSESVGSAAVRDKLRDMADRHRALQQRCSRQLSERCDLVKRGTSPADLPKKLSVTATQLNDARAELAAAVEALFAPY